MKTTPEPADHIMSAPESEPIDDETRYAILAEIAAEREAAISAAPTVEQAQATAKTEDLDRHFTLAGFTVEKTREGSHYEGTSYRRLSKNGKQWVVAYKTDWKVFETHRVFIETWSTWRSGKSGAPGRGRKGWAVDGRFDAIIIYSPQGSYLWWIPRHRLEAHVKGWETEHGIKEITNPSWITLGVAVPDSELSAIGKRAEVERAG
jgi:hypothetical protein